MPLIEFYCLLGTAVRLGTFLPNINENFKKIDCSAFCFDLRRRLWLVNMMFPKEGIS